MNLAELLAWQWQGYPRYHQSRGNLLGHIVLVPLFLAGNIVHRRMVAEFAVAGVDSLAPTKGPTR